MSFLQKVFEQISEKVFLEAVGLLISALACIFYLKESQLIDWRFKLRGYQLASDQIVIVAFDMPLTRDSDNTSITPRDIIAEVVQKVADYKPVVIGLDFELHESEKNDSTFEVLERVILESKNIVLPLELLKTERGYISGLIPPKHLQQNVATGFANFYYNKACPPVRGMKLLTTLYDGQIIPSFALAIIRKYCELQEGGMNWQESLAKIDYPSVADKLYPINYFGQPEALCESNPCVRIFSIEDVLNADLPDEWLKNKIVLIGATFKSKDYTGMSADTFDTPFGKMRGVAVHANIINNLLTQQYIKPLNMTWTLLFTILVVCISFLSLWQLRLKIAIAVALLFFFIYSLASFILFQTHLVLLPLAYPVKIGVLSFFLILYIRAQLFKPRKIREYLDFELLLEDSATPGRYRHRVIVAPTQAGDAKAEITFDDWTTMQSDLSELTWGQTEKAFLKSFGHQLFQHLFAGSVNDCYQRSLTQARMEKKGLRLRLRIDAPELRVIPWEFLYDSRNNFFFANNSEILITRYVESDQPRRNLTVYELKVLIVLSDPNKKSLHKNGMMALDIVKEKEFIINALEELRDRTLIPIQWTIIDHAVMADISRQLLQGFHIFHFIGHSTFQENRGYVVLEDEQHDVLLADEETFSNLFLGDVETRLVFMNSCKSATTSALPELSGLAYNLLQRGIPAVVGMQFLVADETAILFAREFYNNLAYGHPVDLATAQGRLAISHQAELDTIDFGTPVLFMRASDGRIF